MSNQNKQHRQFKRLKFNCLVELENGNARPVCELVDISLRGALVNNCSGASPEAGAACRLIISLNDDDNLQIVMDGVVAHKNENRVGIRCEHIDIDSMTHLRRLIEVNMGDLALLERELNLLWGH